MVKETKLYDLLGVAPSANENEIKKAYRKAALKYHPDKPTGDTEKFKEISEAFDILSNEDKRGIYDDYGLEAARGNAPAGGENPFAGGAPGGGGPSFSFGGPGGAGGHSFSQSDAFNIFSQMGGFGMDDGGFSFGGSGFGGGGGGFGGMPGSFGGPGGGGRARRPEPDTVSIQLPCTLEELYTGATKKMKLSRKSADGSRESKILEIKIKPGWKVGTKINFNNEGDYQRECQARQTVQFIIEEKPHPVFKREGSDLIANVKLTFKEALLGFEKDITTLSGKKINVSRTLPVQPSSTNRYPGQGMPNSKDPRALGDLIVKYKIDFPTSLSPAQKQAIQSAF